MAELISVKEMKDQMKISLKSAYKLIQEPGFPVCRVGGKILIPVDKLQLWIEQGGTSKTSERG